MPMLITTTAANKNTMRQAHGAKVAFNFLGYQVAGDGEHGERKDAENGHAAPGEGICSLGGRRREHPWRDPQR